jgi:hypothetical protein
MATLSPEGERAVAVNFILEKKITGAFLAHYTYDIDGRVTVPIIAKKTSYRRPAS